MGLVPSTIRFLVQEHRKEPFLPPVCTLGRMAIRATLDEMLRIFDSEGVEIKPIAEGTDRMTNMPHWRMTSEAKYTNDIIFFQLLGIRELYALDISPVQSPDFLLDLNKPVPPEMENRFGLILDGGTLEHVFDVKQALNNINRMLKVGGKVIHISPSSDHVDHGFYSFSPILFMSYYQKNRFLDCQAYVSRIGRDSRKPWKLYKYDPDAFRATNIISHLRSARVNMTLFVAKKAGCSTNDGIPIQGENYCARDTTIAISSASSPAEHLRVLYKQHPTLLYLPCVVFRLARALLNWIRPLHCTRKL